VVVLLRSSADAHSDPRHQRKPKGGGDEPHEGSLWAG
jgi:hypothetical protein